MAALPNPYTPGQVPRVLAGRAVELDTIRSQIARVAQYGEIGGPLLVFHAPRGVGKTSLLRTAQRQAQAQGCLTAWISCSRSRTFLPELLRAVERSLQRADVVPRNEARRWRSFLDRITLELGVPGVPVKVSATLASGDRPAPDPGSAPIGALEDLLHDTAVRVRNRGGAGLVLFVDELHAASADEMSILLNAFQNLDGDREDNPLAVVTAGLPVTPEALTRAATFGERSSFVPLDLLAPSDARAALADPADALEVGWTAAALGAVVDEARGHPYFLQLLGSTTWTAAGPEPGGRLTLVDVRRGIPAARRQIEAMHRARWNSATRAEQALLLAMAQAEAAGSGTGNVTRAAIAEGMGMESRSISVPRDRLIEKGVIEPVGHGLVRFTLPGFGAYVRDRDD
ncbi:ATP-binding protein [Nocardioides terrisoli]|uniref:ATP-binding protein n=1 Tax=Nocardioides terrisoli TaxID=3388267 RepID=UPI00287BA6EA|nr:ATP-binding protein [Nocardioides marmorisolisilvae]